MPACAHALLAARPPPAVYSTYVVRSPKVPTECWNNNPCAMANVPALCHGPEGTATVGIWQGNRRTGRRTWLDIRPAFSFRRRPDIDPSVL